MKKLIRITTVPVSLDKLLGNQLTFINQYYEVTAVSADRKELKRIARKYGVKNHHVEMTRKISPLDDLVSVWKLYHFLKKQKPDMVHSHTPKAGIVGMMAGWLAGVPHRFHTVAGLPLMEAKGMRRVVLNNVEKLTYRFATNVYPNSFELHDVILREKFCVPAKLKVLGQGSSNGIDTAFFHKEQIAPEKQTQLRRKLGILPDDFVYVFVGRLVGDKGINELVQAFKNLESTDPETQQRHLKLVLVGNLEKALDPLKSETTKEIEANPHILTVGFKDDVRPYFAISDALVFPSYREGFPNVVLQSLAMEVPAIVTNISGCSEIITEDHNGIIVPVKDETALEKAMKRLLMDSELYGRLKETSRKSVAPYEQKMLWEALLAEYERVMGG